MNTPVSHRRPAPTSPGRPALDTPASAKPAVVARPPVMQRAPTESTIDRVLTVPVIGPIVGGVVQAKLALFDSKGEAPHDKPHVAVKILKGAAFPFVTVGYWLAGAVGRLTGR